MIINIGDLFILLDTEVYYVSDIQYDEEMMMKKFILILMNPKKGIKLRKRIMHPDNIEKIFDPESIINKNWKHFPVIE